MLVHRLAWRNKFLVNNALTVKIDHQNALDVRSTFESREPLKSLCCPHGIITESCLEHFMRFRCSFPEFETKFHANAFFFQINHFTYNRKPRVALNTNNNKHSLRSSTKGYGGKTHYTNSQNSDTTAPSGRELYHLQFSLQAASPETFGYTLVNGPESLLMRDVMITIARVTD
jgi:hypothetical protein